MALWLLPKRGLLRVGAKANVPLCGGKKMNKKCAVGKKKKYRRVSKECRLTRCPVSIWSVFVCLSVKMVYFSCPSVRYCQVARSSVTLAANVLQYETVGFSERVPIHRWKKLERELKPRKPLNPNCFILCVGGC